MSARSSVLSVVLAAVLVGAAHSAGATVQVEPGDGGLRVAADDARLEDVLGALAEEEGFEVVMQLGVERRPVNVDLHDVTLEEALRRILRRRNYAISYEETEDGLEVSRVHVLLPGAAVAERSKSSRSAAVAAAESQRRLVQARQRAEQRRLAQQAAERARQRREWTEKARQAQRRREARAAASEPVPLRRLLWGRTR